MVFIHWQPEWFFCKLSKIASGQQRINCTDGLITKKTVFSQSDVEVFMKLDIEKCQRDVRTSFENGFDVTKSWIEIFSTEDA